MKKKYIRKVARSCGVELNRYNPSSSHGAQLIKVLEVGTIDIVFDIGANQGQFSKEIREYGYSRNIVNFEPLTSACENLMAFESRDPAWYVHGQVAIGDHDGHIEINIAGNQVSSSEFPTLESHSSAAVGQAYVSSDRVPIVSLDSVASQYLQA